MFGQAINKVGKITDKGKGFGKRAAHPNQIFLGVPFGGAEENSRQLNNSTRPLGCFDLL